VVICCLFLYSKIGGYDNILKISERSKIKRVVKNKSYEDKNILKLLSFFVLSIIILSIGLPFVNQQIDQEPTSTNKLQSTEYETLEQTNSGLDVLIDPPSRKEGSGGDILSYDFEVINNGSQPDSYDWYADSGHEWLISEDNGQIVDLEAGSSIFIELVIEIPDDVESYAADRLVLEVISQTDPEVSAKGETYTYSDARYGSRIEPIHERIEASPGSTFVVPYRLTNIGNIVDSYELMPYVDSEYWEVSTEERTELLEPSESTVIGVTVSIPEMDMDYELDKKEIYYGARNDIVLNARASNGVINTVTPGPTSVEVLPHYVAALRPLDLERSIDYSETTKDITFDFELRNLCNVKDEEDFELDIIVEEKDREFLTEVRTDQDLEKERWSTSVTDPEVTLEGGETEIIMVRITSPRKPLVGTFSPTFIAEPSPRSDVPEEYIHPGTGSVSVSVNQTGDVEVFSEQQEITAQPLETVPLYFTISNIGNGIDDFELNAYTENGWEVDFPEDDIIYDIHPYERETFSVEVTIPKRIGVDHLEKVTVVAVSRYENENHGAVISDLSESNIRIIEYYSLEMEPESNSTTVYPDETASYQISITNLGNTEDTITLSLDHTSIDSWNVQLKDTRVTLDRWSTTSTELYVTPSDDSIHDELFDVSVIGTSQGNSIKVDSVYTTTEVEHVPEVEIELLDYKSDIKPGETNDVNLRIINNGNAYDSFQISAASENNNWGVQISENNFELQPDETTEIMATVTAPDKPSRPTIDRLESLGILADNKVNVEINAAIQADRTAEDSIDAIFTVGQVREHQILSGDKKEILPDGSVTHTIEVYNWGNSQDEVILDLGSVDNDPYLDYATLERERVSLNIAESSELNLTLNAPSHLKPHLYQELDIIVGNSDFSASTKTVTEVVMISNENPSRTIKIGKTAEYDITIVNVPVERENRGPGDSLPDNFYLTAPVDEFEDDGWNVSIEVDGSEIDIEEDYLDFERAYERKDIRIKLNAPLIERQEVSVFEIIINSEMGRFTEDIITRTETSWFDLRPIDISVDPFENARQLDIEFEIERSGKEDIFSTNQKLNDIPIKVIVNDEIVNNDNIELMGIDRKGSTREIYTYGFTCEVDEWAWEETAKNYEIQVIVDPDDEIHMINAQGTADENNELTRENTFSRYHGIPIWLPLLVLLIGMLFFAFSWFKTDEYTFLSLLTGASLGAVIGSIVIITWNWFIRSFPLINFVTLGIKITAMALFVVFLFLVNVKIRPLLSHVTNHVVKNSDNRKKITDDERFISPSFHSYYLTLSLTGAITFLTFLLITNLDFILIGEYFGLMTIGFFDVKSFIYIPIIIFVAVYALVGFVAGIYAKRLQEKLWYSITRNRKKVEELKIRSLKFTEGE